MDARFRKCPGGCHDLRPDGVSVAPTRVSRGQAPALMHAVAVAALLGALRLPPPAEAQTATAIIPDAGAAGLDTSVVAVSGFNLIDGGRLSGASLFHSFSRFDLASGESAVWVRSADDGSSIRNVINRVTGGGASQIDGSLSVNLPNADFYFINPAGVVFGEGASVSAPGAVRISTAQELRFADGATFSAVTPAGSVFSVAAPQAFGFLGGSGDIVSRSLSVRSPVGTQLAAANLDLTNARLTIQCGDATCDGQDRTSVDLVAVGSGANSIALDGGAIASRPSGKLTLREPQVNVSAAGDLAVGGIRLSGDNVSIRGGNISAPTRGAGKGGDIRIQAGEFALAGGQIQSSTQGSGAGGTIELRVDRDAVIRDFNNSRGQIAATAGSPRTTGSPGGRGGAVMVAVGGSLLLESDPDQIPVNDAPEITATASGRAAAPGAISISVEKDLILRSGIIDTTNTAAGGATPIPGAGNVSIRAGNLKFELAEGVAPSSAQISTSSLAGQDAGDITLEVKDSVSGRTGGISSVVDRQSGLGAVGAGVAGDIRITAGRIEATELGITSEARFGGLAAGSIQIAADEIALDGSTITTATDSRLQQSQRGELRISADKLLLTDSTVNSGTTGSQAGGDVTLTGDFIRIVGGDTTTSASDEGEAGAVRVAANRVELEDGARVSSESTISAAGAIKIEAQEVVLRDGVTVTTNSVSRSAGSITFETPKTGYIDVRDSTITTSSGAQSGGRISITEPAAVITRGGSILALGEVRSANVEIRSDFWIAEADRINRLSVDGQLLLDSQLQDASRGAISPAINFHDASRILRSRCPVTRADGRGSALSLPASGPGPYASGGAQESCAGNSD